MSASHISPDWALFYLSFAVAITSGIGAVFGYFIKNIHIKLEGLQNQINQLEVELEKDFTDKEKKILTEIKYNLKTSNIHYANEIKNIYRLIENIEIRFKDRSNFAKAKWQNLTQVINSIIRYLEKTGYVARDLPLIGADTTLSDEQSSMDTDVY